MKSYRSNDTQSLLDKAKAVPVRKMTDKVTDEQLDLVRAWLNKDITLTQAMKATRMSSGRIYLLMAIGARVLWNERNGK